MSLLLFYREWWVSRLKPRVSILDQGLSMHTRAILGPGQSPRRPLLAPLRPGYAFLVLPLQEGCYRATGALKEILPGLMTEVK
jgi:hypothetical protein